MILYYGYFSILLDMVSHQYQQIITDFNDEKHFYIKLTGPTFDYYLNKSSSICTNHLAYSIDSDGDLELTVHPGILFLDFKMQYMIQKCEKLIFSLVICQDQ